MANALDSLKGQVEDLRGQVKKQREEIMMDGPLSKLKSGDNNPSMLSDAQDRLRQLRRERKQARDQMLSQLGGDGPLSDVRDNLGDIKVGQRLGSGGNPVNFPSSNKKDEVEFSGPVQEGSERIKRAGSSEITFTG